MICYYNYIDNLRFFEYKGFELIQNIIKSINYKEININKKLNFDDISLINISKNHNKENSYKINYASTNIEYYLKITKENIVNKNLEEFLPTNVASIHAEYMDNFSLHN